MITAIMANCPTAFNCGAICLYEGFIWIWINNTERIGRIPEYLIEIIMVSKKSSDRKDEIDENSYFIW